MSNSIKLKPFVRRCPFCDLELHEEAGAPTPKTKELLYNHIRSVHTHDGGLPITERSCASLSDGGERAWRYDVRSLKTLIKNLTTDTVVVDW